MPLRYVYPVFFEFIGVIFAICIILTLIFLTFAKKIDASVVVDFLSRAWDYFVLRKRNPDPDPEKPESRK